MKRGSDEIAIIQTDSIGPAQPWSSYLPKKIKKTDFWQEIRNTFDNQQWPTHSKNTFRNHHTCFGRTN